MRLKAQMAMEFLYTYGWAILVVLVAIAALAYFGVLDPKQFLPKYDEFGIPRDLSARAGFICDNLVVDEYFDDNTMAITTYPLLQYMGEELQRKNNWSYYEFDRDAKPWGGIAVDCLDEEDLEDNLCDIYEQEIINMNCNVLTRLCYEEIKGDGAYCLLMDIILPLKYEKWEEWYKGLDIR